MNPGRNYEIKNFVTLKKLLWSDFILGSTNGLAGIVFSNTLANIFGLSPELIKWISIITLIYAVAAFSLAIGKNISIFLLRILVLANWAWALISLILLWQHYEKATHLGQVFLILQILVVGGLAYLEGNQITKTRIAGN